MWHRDGENHIEVFHFLTYFGTTFAFRTAFLRLTNFSSSCPRLHRTQTATCTSPMEVSVSCESWLSLPAFLERAVRAVPCAPLVPTRLDYRPKPRRAKRAQQARGLLPLEPHSAPRACLAPTARRWGRRRRRCVFRALAGSGAPSAQLHACLSTGPRLAISSSPLRACSCSFMLVGPFQYVISTLTGIPGVSGTSGDGGAAELAPLGFATGMTVSVSGDVYFSDWGYNKVCACQKMSTRSLPSDPDSPVTHLHFLLRLPRFGW